MRKTLLLSILILLISTSPVFAALSTEALAERMVQGQEMFDRLLQDRNKQVDAIMSNPAYSSMKKQQMIKDLQDTFLQRSRGIHAKYREPFLKRIVEETNAGLPEGQKIKLGQGTSVYEMNKATGKPKINPETGKPVFNTSHRGMQGDLDLGGNTKAVTKLEQNMNKYGIPVTSDAMHGPGYKDFKGSEVTINIEGRMGTPGSNAHLTQVQMDAFSKETYSSAAMKKTQAGKKLVETNDHIKKATKGFGTKPQDLLSHKSEDVMQGMSKGTLKSIDIPDPKKPITKPQHVTDDQLKKILKDSGYDGDVNKFKSQLENIKEGQLARGVGLDEKNMESFQKACKKTTEQAVENAKALAEKDFKKLDERIKKFEDLSNSPDLPEDQKNIAKKKLKKLQEEAMDSKIRIEQTTLANQEKLKGGDYDTFYEKNSGGTQKKLKKIPSTTTPPLSRVDTIKKGLKPGLLDAAGYGYSAYSIFSTSQQVKEGKISESEAAIIIARETIDTGFGIVTDVAQAGAIGSIGTGSVATIAAPLIVFAASSYAVGQAAEDGLRMAKSFKDEEIVKMIAKSKTEETVNTLQLTAEEMVKAGNATGDWRYFAKADDVIYALQKLHQTTGDDFYLKRSFQLADHVDKAKETLEEKYGCSIYAVRQKKIEEERAEFEAQQAAELEKKKAAQAEIEAAPYEPVPETATTPPVTAEPVSSPPGDEGAPTGVAEADYSFTGKMRVMELSTGIAIGIGPKDSSRDLWGPIQQNVLQTLQEILGNTSELIRIGKLSNAEWAQEKARLYKNMGQTLVQIASSAPYKPEYENLINNWVGSGYITRGEADAAIASMNSEGETGGKDLDSDVDLPEGYMDVDEGQTGPSSSAKDFEKVIVDGYWIQINTGSPSEERFALYAYPASYGAYSRPVTIDGKLLYTNKEEWTIKAIAKYEAEGNNTYDIYPGQSEMVIRNDGIGMGLLSYNREDLIHGFGGPKKTKENPYKNELVRVLQAANAEGAKIEQGPIVAEFDKLRATNISIKQQAEALTEKKDLALYNSLVNTYTANRNRMIELSNTPEWKRMNEIAPFTQKLSGLMNQGKWREAHEFAMKSGMAQGFDYKPPKEQQ
ncbi:hypothetical protein ACFL5C_01775 [Candidatus Omnitrophota bacterium]